MNTVHAKRPSERQLRVEPLERRETFAGDLLGGLLGGSLLGANVGLANSTSVNANVAGLVGAHVNATEGAMANLGLTSSGLAASAGAAVSSTVGANVLGIPISAGVADQFFTQLGVSTDLVNHLTDTLDHVAGNLPLI